MSWIQIDSNLTDKPQVYKLARALKLDRWAIAGRLMELWGWCDLHTTDGRTGLSEKEMDARCGKAGFSRAMIDVGWLKREENGELSVVQFSKYNGATAKERNQAARRQANFKARKANAEVTQGGEKSNAESVTEVTDESLAERYQEKRREYKENTLLSESAKESPAAPSHRRQRSHLRPADSSEVATAMAADPTLVLNGQELMDCAACFFDKYEANGWIDRDGHIIENWFAAARGYARKWKANLRADSGRRGSRGGSNTTNRQQDCNDPSRYQ